MRAYVIAQLPSVGHKVEKVLNDFFSRTTWLIPIKLSRTHFCGMGIQICSDKGADPFWYQIRDKLWEILINLQKVHLSNHWLESIDN